jgi:hypothetical protein
MTSRRTSIGEQFAPHTISMLRSPAWRALTLSARRVLDRIEIELADHGGTDNGKLPVTYDDFVRYGVHRHAIAPAIREVVALGFVEITEPGRAGNADWRKPNLLRLTFRNTKYAPTNEWQKITEEQAEQIARAARTAAPQKTKRQCRKMPNPSDGIPVTENAKSIVRKPSVQAIVRKPSVQAIVRKPSLLSISRGRSGRERSQSLRRSPRRVRLPDDGLRLLDSRPRPGGGIVIKS